MYETTEYTHHIQAMYISSVQLTLRIALRHFGTQASVLYVESVLYSAVRVISFPICTVITVMMLFDIEA